jgi:hypothetical protein
MAVHDQWIGKDPIGLSVGLKLARFQDQYSVTEVENEVQVVCGNDQCSSESLENRQELSAGAWIEITGWFVQDQDRRCTGQDARQANSLSFTRA